MVVRTADVENRHDCFVLVDGAVDLALGRLVATDIPWEGGSVANEIDSLRRTRNRLTDETVPRGRFSLLGPRGFVTPSAKRPNQRGEREEGDGYPNDDQT